KVLEYPTFFIIGIVKAPVDTTLAIADPLIEPMKPDAMAATLAGPPRVWPAMASARSLNRVDIPDLARKAAKRIKKIMYVDDTPIAIPKMPSDVANKMYVKDQHSKTQNCIIAGVPHLIRPV